MNEVIIVFEVVKKEVSMENVVLILRTTWGKNCETLPHFFCDMQRINKGIKVYLTVI